MAAPIKQKPVILVIAIFGLLLTQWPSSAHEHGHAHGGHGHAHDHGHGHAHGQEQPAHFKYSQAANEAPPQENHHGHDHGHAHTHDHDHGHAHDHGQAHDHGHDKNHDHEGQTAPKTQNKYRETGLNLWLIACGSTALVSVAPVFILMFIPIEDTHTGEQPLLKVLLAFASGGLLGDAFLHLIPHALSPHSHTGEEHGHGHSHDHGHSHGGEEGHDHSHDMGIGLWVLAGIVAFLVVEKFVRFVKGGHGHSHGHGPDPTPAAKNTKETKQSEDDTVRQRKKTDKKEEDDKKDQTEVVKKGDIKVAGYLNLAADFAHNFTDGLAIGASYLAGRNIGIITTVTILLHEVPHEVGDFAILVQSGCTKKKAMMLQFTTAFGAMFGTIVSLMAEGIGDAAVAWILPFTAGGFIYIATVSVIPELLEDCKPWQTVKEIVALLVGIYMMVLIAEYE